MNMTLLIRKLVSLEINSKSWCFWYVKQTYLVCLEWVWYEDDIETVKADAEARTDTSKSYQKAECAWPYFDSVWLSVVHWSFDAGSHTSRFLPAHHRAICSMMRRRGQTWRREGRKISTSESIRWALSERINRSSVPCMSRVNIEDAKEIREFVRWTTSK